MEIQDKLFKRIKLKIRPYHPGMAAAIILAVLAGLLFSTARQKSLVYDEVIYAPMGFLYWKTGDLSWNASHPPLQKLISSLPLLTQKLNLPTHLDPFHANEWRAGYRIFFHSEISPQRLIFLARLPSILASLLMAGLLIFIGWRRVNPTAGILAGLVFSFDPLVIGNGSLAMDDIFVSGFFFLAVLFFQDHLRGGKGSALWSGLLTGLAIATKLSGILLLPIFLSMCLHQTIINFTHTKSRAIGRPWQGLIVTPLLASLVVLLIYRFDGQALMQTFRSAFQIHHAPSMQGFLLKNIPGSSTWFYYPVAVLIKTPIPLLFLWVCALVILYRNRSASRFWNCSVHALLFLGFAALLTKNQFGIRYLMPMVPFLALSIGEAASFIRDRKNKLALVLAVVWLAGEAAWVHPHHMAYFNELIGGPRQGHRWLDGSNQDWGQDIPALKNFWEKENRPSLLLGYYGSNDPGAWGIEYQDVMSPSIMSSFQNNSISPVDVQREYLAVSARLRSVPGLAQVYRWLDKKTPIALLGYTIFVYDITSDLESTLNLAQIYEIMGRTHHARRQYQRALQLDPKNPTAQKGLNEKPSSTSSKY